MNIDDTAKKQQEEDQQQQQQQQQQGAGTEPTEQGTITAATSKRVQQESDDDASTATPASAKRTKSNAGAAGLVTKTTGNVGASSNDKQTSPDAPAALITQQSSTSAKDAQLVSSLFGRKYWWLGKTDLAMLMAGFMPRNAAGPGLPSAPWELLVHLTNENLVPKWFWEDRDEFLHHEENVALDAGFGPPYRGSYPGMNEDQIASYLKTRFERLDNEEVARLLHEARTIRSEMVEIKDKAAMQELTFAEAAPSDDWLKIRSFKMKEAGKRISEFAEPSYFTGHVFAMTQTALWQLYETRLGQDEVLDDGDMALYNEEHQPRRDEEAKRRLTAAYYVLEQVRKIKDKAAKEDSTFAQACPSSGWLELHEAEMKEASKKTRKRQSKGCTHFETYVHLMTSMAHHVISQVKIEGPGYKPLSYVLRASRGQDGDSFLL